MSESTQRNDARFYGNPEPESTFNLQADDSDQSEFSEALDRLKDGKKAWIVCFGAWLIQVLNVGFMHAYGIFFVAFIEEFQCSKAEAAWVGSLAYGFTMSFGILASALINRWGNAPVAISGSCICVVSLIATSFAPSIEVMFFTFSFLYGIGCSLSYTPTMCFADDYFKKYVTLATGIMTAGSSCGTLILNPLSQVLVTQHGWRYAMRILAGMSTVCIAVGWLFRPLAPGIGSIKRSTPSQVIKRSKVRKLMAELQLWKNKVYVIWIGAITLVMFGYYIPYVHLVSYATDIGVPPEMGSFLVMILGASTATGRILFGKVVEGGYLNRLHMHQLSMVITGTGIMCLPLITSFGGLVAYVIIVGLVDGCYVVLLPVLTSTLAGAENKVLGWGFVVAVSSVTYTLGPPVAGWIYDGTGSYNLAFHVGGVPVVLGAVVLFFIPWAQRTARSTNLMRAARESYDAIKTADLLAEEMEDQTNTSLANRDNVSVGSMNSTNINDTVVQVSNVQLKIQSSSSSSSSDDLNADTRSDDVAVTTRMASVRFAQAMAIRRKRQRSSTVCEDNPSQHLRGHGFHGALNKSLSEEIASAINIFRKQSDSLAEVTQHTSGGGATHEPII